VQLDEARRELQELRANLRVAQKEKEAFSEAPLNNNSRPSSPSPSSEDDKPPPPSADQPVTYSLCDSTEVPFPISLSSSVDTSLGRVVVSQPAPLSAPQRTGSNTPMHSLESEGEEQKTSQSGSISCGEESALKLPDHTGSILSELTDSPLW
ncbi:hypothetical protein JZ751_018094, partial [Albula glossodonta]